MNGKPTNLQHLDEGDTQIQVHQVTENQTQTEEDADGDDSAPMTFSFVQLSTRVCTNM